MKYIDPDRNYGFLLHDVTRMMRRTTLQRIAGLGLTDAQARALVFIARNEGTNQVLLADMLEIQPITLARTIDKLQEAGLVERRMDPNDRRAFLLYLTDKASPILGEVWKQGQKTKTEALIGFSDEEKEALLSMLSRMKANLTECAAGKAGAVDEKDKS